MSTDSLLWLLLVLILVEYVFRLRRSIGEKADEKFEKLKSDFLRKESEKADPKQEANQES